MCSTSKTLMLEYLLQASHIVAGLPSGACIATMVSQVFTIHCTEGIETVLKESALYLQCGVHLYKRIWIWVGSKRIQGSVARFYINSNDFIMTSDGNN